MDNKKDINRSVQKPEEVLPSVRAYFRNNPSAIYIFKKTEKLVSAMYLITNHIKDDEPIKRHVREHSILLLSDFYELQVAPIDREQGFLTRVEGRILQLISELEVLCVARLIGKGNHDVVRTELVNVLSTLAQMNLSESSDSLVSVLSNEFFAVQKEYLKETKNHRSHTVPANQFVPTFDKRHFKRHVQNNDRKTVSVSNAGISDSAQSSGSPVKDNESHFNSQKHRREIIITTVKELNEVGIKDIAVRITDCSEKTIQRELLSLVEEGVLRKEGERRWSRYRMVAVV